VDADGGFRGANIGVVIIAVIRLYRDSLAHFLDDQRDVRVLATACDRADALVRLRELKPDVVLLDMAVPETPAVVRAIVQAAPDVKVVAVAAAEREHDVAACAEAGAAGYLSSDHALPDLVATIQQTARGDARGSPAAQDGALSSVALTAREVEVLELIDQGLSNKEIAQRLFIELPTVKNHVHHILTKLRVHRRGQAVARVRGVFGWRGWPARRW
jgi:two-component system, NarL family, nitrate/nitrite response regulator NarL